MYLSRQESEGEAAVVAAVGALGGQGVELHTFAQPLERSSCKITIINVYVKQETAACSSVWENCLVRDLNAN